ncbi:MAG: DNA-binding PadR family transcriptional regulator [Lentisphaeria bacterium]
MVRRLADQGLLDSHRERAEGRERRYYPLSELGGRLLGDLTREWRELNRNLSQVLALENDIT